ncbi:MAG: hypothetical protein U0871_08205 [Gemmataceae bacterium]
MKLYRTMKVAPAGGPLVGQRRSMLGVRPTDPTNATPGRRADVSAVTDTDPVKPKSDEGLSVYTDPAMLKLGRGEVVWVIDTDDLPPTLAYTPDHEPHGLITPAVPMTLGQFQAELAATADLWEVPAAEDDAS